MPTTTVLTEPRQQDTPTPLPAAITVTGLTKRYGNDEVVGDLSFSIPAGKVTGFLGPNGAGKTTTIRMILGLVRPTAGVALVEGEPFTRLSDPTRKVGVLIEGAQAHPSRTAHDHLRILAIERSIDPGSIDEVLERVHLTDARDRNVSGFSLGMRQRLDLAAALLGDPEILILDEPANGLDPAGIRWLREFLRTYAESGRTVFVSSHQLAETSQLAEDVVVISRGRLITHTSVRELTAESIVRVRSPQIDVLVTYMREAGGEVRHREGNTVELAGVPIEMVGRIAATAAVELHELATHTQSLEDVFLDLTSQGERP